MIRGMKRLQFGGPDREARLCAGWGGDEFGNPTLYVRCPLFDVVWWYPTGHFQTDVELPEPGENPWIDRVFYGVDADDPHPAA